MDCPIRERFREAGLVVMKPVRDSYAFNLTDQDLITVFFSF